MILRVAEQFCGKIFPGFQVLFQKFLAGIWPVGAGTSGEDHGSTLFGDDLKALPCFLKWE